MSTAAWLVALTLIAIPVLAQDQRRGASVPQPIDATGDSQSNEAPANTPAKPSAAMPMPATAQAPTVYGPYVPYRGPAVAAGPAQPFDPDANIVTPQTAGRHPLSGYSAEPQRNLADPDAGIVTRVPTRPGEISDGTLLRVRLREQLSTVTTVPGTLFSAEVSEPIMQDGKTYIPAGSVVSGRVTSVRGGKRIGGAAAIHLEPRWVTLPDGTQYLLHARVIDTSSWNNTRVDDEGTITRRDSIKHTLEAGALVTGGATAAGAVLGGPPGALIGAGIGVGATAVVWLKQDRQAVLPKDLGLIFSLTAPVTVDTRISLPAAAGGE